jgi:hypothetical protein
LEVVRDLVPARESHDPVSAAPNERVESARRAAESALAEVGPLVSSVEGRAGAENMASLCLERGELAYSKGVALQKEIAGAQDPDAVARAAMESFQLAVDAAGAAEQHAVQLQGPRGGNNPSPRWGRFGTALDSE